MTPSTFPHRHRRPIATSLALLAAVTAVAAGPARSQAPPPAEPAGFEIERTHWQGKAAAGATFEVINAFGDVRARFGGYEGVVEVQAVIQHFADEGPRLRVEAREETGGVKVVVGYPNSVGGELSTRHVAGQKKRADLVVFVPQGVNLRTTTTDGFTEIRGLRGDVEARSTGGALQVRSVKGDLRLRTESGAIVAVPETLDHTAVQQLRSTTGDVAVYLFEDGNFTVRASTRGLLSTDYSLRVADDPQDPALKHGEATLGKGITPIEVACGSGHVRLVRKPSAALARAQEGSP